MSKRHEIATIKSNIDSLTKSVKEIKDTLKEAGIVNEYHSTFSITGLTTEETYKVASKIKEATEKVDLLMSELGYSYLPKNSLPSKAKLVKLEKKKKTTKRKKK